MIKQITLGLIASTLAVLPALAQNVQNRKSSIYKLVDESEGYVNIRDNVLLVEGEDSIKVCHFGLTAEFFQAHAAQNEMVIAATKPKAVCVDLDTLSVAGAEIDNTSALYEMVDTSVGYTPISANTVLVEGEDRIDVCRFDLSNEFFAAASLGNAAGVPEDQRKVICVPLQDIVK